VLEGSTLRLALPSCPRGIAPSAIAERMLPEGGHLAKASFTLFTLDDSGSAAPPPTYAGDATAASPLVCLSVVRTRLTSSNRRGAEMRALGVASRVPWLDLLRPLLMAALDAYNEAPSGTALRELVDALNGAAIPPPLPRVQRALLRARIPLQQRSIAHVFPPRGVDDNGADDSGRLFDEVDVALRPADGWRASVRVPRWLEVSDAEGMGTCVRPLLPECTRLTIHLRRLTHSMRAILFFSAQCSRAPPSTPRRCAHCCVDSARREARCCSRRCSWSGVCSSSASKACTPVSLPPVHPLCPCTSRVHSCGVPAANPSRRHVDAFDPTGEVASLVMACTHFLVPAAAAHAGPRAELLRRLYPHASLSDTAFLDTKGFVAGVTNPIFEAKS